jgi:SAM-dependent methyltransferase
MADGPAAAPDGPPARVRVIGRTISWLVARFPFLWRFLRGPTRRFFDGVAPGWSRVVRNTPQRMASLEAALAELDHPPDRILDLGTGTGTAAGWLAGRFPRAEVVGVDISPAMIDLARAGLDPALADRLRFEVADADRVDPGLGTFDLIVQVSVPAFFAGIARVLRPGGYVIVISSLGTATPFHTPPHLLERGFRRQGIDVVATGAAGPGTFVVAHRPQG